MYTNKCRYLISAFVCGLFYFLDNIKIDIKPEHFGEGCRNLSEEIDGVLYEQEQT